MDFRKSRYRGIDLHTHSTASDGTLTPLEIIALAAQSNLAAISITDHDTLEGVRQISTAALPAGLQFLSGIEISTSPPTSFPISGSLHILGYGIRVDDPALNTILGQLKTSRDNRTPGIIAKLNGLGFNISYAEVHRLAGDGQVGRPHVAACMVKKGYAASMDDAFSRYLGHGKPAYVDRYRITATEAISLVRAAGGVPVLAHPMLYGLPDVESVQLLVEELIKAGIMGIEVYYPDHSEVFTRQLSALAQQRDLLMTGGTDFHGDLKPDTHLGMGTGDFWVPFGLFEKLQAVIS